MPQLLELGLETFGDRTLGADGELVSHAQAMRDLVDQAVLADRERGWPPPSRASFEREIASGALYVGSPETVAQKIAATAKRLRLDRFDLKYSTGPLPHAKMLASIELYGTRVAPRVRELLG